MSGKKAWSQTGAVIGWVIVLFVRSASASPPKPTQVPEVPTDASIAFASWLLSGSEQRFRSYASPPRGLFLAGASIAFPEFRGERGLIWGANVTEQDYTIGSQGAVLFGRLRGSFFVSRNRFFRPTPLPLPPSQRVVRDLSLRHLFTPDFSVSFNYSMQMEDHFFDPPKDPLGQRTRYWDLVGEGKVGSGFLSVGYQHRFYRDRMLAQPNVTVRGWRALYLWEMSPDIGVETSFSRFSVRQPARPINDITALSFAAEWAPGANSFVDTILRREAWDLPAIGNAAVRERRLLSASLRHRFAGWTVLIRGTQKEAERIRGDRTFVDVPRWRTWETRLSGRLGESFRLTFKGSTQHLNHPPVMVAADARPLFYDDRRSFQLRLEGGSPRVSGYLTAGHERFDNDARAVEITLRSLIIGCHYQLSERASLFAEYAYDNWTAKSEMADFPNVDNFLSNSRVTALGLQWTVDRRTSLNLALSDFATANDNPLLLRNGNTSGRFLTGSVTYRFPAGYQVSFTLSPWRYRDRVAGALNYDTSLILISGTARF